jgi:hypothetical protein
LRRVVHDDLAVTRIVKSFLPFAEPKDSLRCSVEFATCSCAVIVAAVIVIVVAAAAAAVTAVV